ncbi:hypothetical protein HNY73_018033 [Argiope bruennichi]|uniref:Secreted protein n=1 Tax=Argiope bruennichi TaxID=94029 RepID=A0A8T0EEV9_ARGBR|nr:hypothetical protein HNY73_018033 [Argiope bruennichi]
MWIKFGSIMALLVGAVISDPITRRARGVLCGTQLSEALSLACGSNFYVPREARNSPLGMLKNNVAFIFLGRHRRQHRGVGGILHKPMFVWQETT